MVVPARRAQQQKMGFSVQPNEWQCGPYALYHALMLLGVKADVAKLTKVARTRRDRGTNELQLRRAARRYHCSLPQIRRLDPERARREMVEYLREGYPVLLCVDEWQHWVTVARWEAGKYILLDSEEDAVFTVLTWGQLKRRWVYREPDEYDNEACHTLYDFYPLVPRFRVKARPQSFSPPGENPGAGAKSSFVAALG
ncbi:MAG: hypothetical protein KatS3mg105_2965 [Gemmatales bacterium]|nr:MAG: hypothetical protein KatS3mg105_2965 [Gemmatales bacterium]